MGFEPISFKFSTTIPAYRIVTMLTGTSDTVKLCAAVTDYPLGITVDTVLETALAGPVQCHGIARLQFNETMSSGKLVQCDANSLGTPLALTSTGGYVIGLLVGPTIALTGTVSTVLINPFWIDQP